MAYGLRYTSTWVSEYNSGRTYFYKQDYTGTTTALTLASNSIKISYGFDGWTHPIVKMNLSLTIINNLDDIFELFDLLETREKEWKVKVWNDTTGILLFDGFINADAASYDYHINKPVNITASMYLNKLSNVHPDIFDSISNTMLSQILFESIKMTGIDDSFDIKVNNSLVSSGHTTSETTSFLEQAGITTENFWKNNVERESAKTAIEAILKPFDSYIYYYDGSYYIERYSDLWSTGKTFRVYPDLDTYSGSTTTSGETSTIYELFDDFYLLSEPKLTIDNGLGTYEVNLKLKKYLNLCNPYYIGWTSWTGTTPAEPEFRQWQHTVLSKTDYDFETYSGDTVWKQINYPAYLNIISGSTWRNEEYWGYNEEMKYRGVFTKFKLTVAESGTTDLNLSWKWGQSEVIYIADWKHESLDHYEIYWYLRLAGTSDYFTYDDTNDEWQKVTTTQDNAFQMIEVKRDQVDQGTGIYKTSVTIPLSDIDNLDAGDQEFVLCMAYAMYDWDCSANLDGSCHQRGYIRHNVVGDATVSVSGSLQANKIVAEVEDSPFLDKQEVTLDLFESENFNIKNGFYQPNNYEVRIQTWTDDDVNFYPTWKHLIASRFQLYGNNWYKMKLRLKTDGQLRMFDKIQDTNNSHFADMKFIVTSFDYIPEQDLYDNVTLYQWADENVNFTT